MPELLTIVVPVYSNEPSLDELFHRIDAVSSELRERHDVEVQVVTVDDGSTDNSYAKLLAISNGRPDVRVVKLTRNFGAVHASRTGLGFVDGDCFVILAADLQDPPELLLEMIPLWRQGHKFVIAERRSRRDPILSRAFAWIYYRLIRTFVVKDYPNRGFDIALMDRDMLPYMRDAAKHAFTPLLAYWLGFKPAVVTYDRPERQYGESGWSFRRRVKAFIDVLFGFSATPIRLMSTIGVIVALGSLAYGSLVVFAAIRGQIPVDGFATVASLITFLLGLILLMLGLIGEYLWRIADELNQRPEAVVEDVH